MKKKLCALLLALLCLAGCGGSGSKNWTPAPKSSAAPAWPLAETEAEALTEFSLNLLRENWNGENLLLSPLSVLSALGMTANGAQGETLAQMEAVLGLPVEELNKTLAAWTENLPRESACRADLANALWLRDDGSLVPEETFLQTVADWYGAEVFSAPFDAGTRKDINRWVDRNTHGMIPEILEDIPKDVVLYLVNALALEAEWETVYRTDQVWDHVFTTGEGEEQTGSFLYSSEGYYLKDDGAQGFLKPYKGGRWAFAALLPEEGTALRDYLASLTGKGLHALLKHPEETLVEAAIPKFQCRYGVNLVESLKAMGMPSAFLPGEANFSGMGTAAGPLFISGVLHRTYLSVDEKGTKAGAATAVAMSGGGGTEITPVVHLDRPFLYLLVDLETGLPAFLGAVTELDASVR